MNVDIKNIEQLLKQVQEIKKQVEIDNLDLNKELDSYINDDGYSSKAFDRSKNKMEDVVKPILKQYFKVLDVFESDLLNCINYYHQEVDVINLDSNEIERLISLVKTEKEKEEGKLTLSRKLKTTTASSFVLENKINTSYEAYNKLEKVLINKNEKLDQFNSTQFFNGTKTETSKLKSMLLNAKKSNLMSVNTNVEGVCDINELIDKLNKPPKLEDYEKYEDYLIAVGEYADRNGYAKEIEINGIKYYEFNGDIAYNNYNEFARKKLYIAVVDGKAMVYLKSLDGGQLSVPNGILMAAPISDAEIDVEPIGENGEKSDFFQQLFTESFDSSKMGASVATQRSSNFDKLDNAYQQMIKNYTQTIADKKISNDIAIAMTTKLANEQEYTDYSLDVLNKVAEPYVSDLIDQNDRLAYMGGEIEVHAEGIIGNSIDARFGRRKFAGKGEEGKYNSAMKTGDLDKFDKNDTGQIGGTMWTVKNLYLREQKELIKKRFEEDKK